MAFLVQDDDGNVASATAYVETSFVDDYFSDRNIPEWAGSAAVKQAAVIKATDYIDRRYAFMGWTRNDTQGTEWPRNDVVDLNDRIVSGIPAEVKEACAELAIRSLSAVLAPDPALDELNGEVRFSSIKVGPIEERKSYIFQRDFPRYPEVDALLRAYVVPLGEIVRG
jgi:hypothetical protein